MANISEKVEQIRKAIYGKDVRESIASGIEAINDHVETTVAAEETREANEAERIANYSAIITEYENFNEEVEQARESLAKEKEFDTLGARLEESEQDLANHETAADPHDQYALDTDLATLESALEGHELDDTAHGIGAIAQAVDNLEQEVSSHMAENVQDAGGVHGLEVEEGTWTPSLAGATFDVSYAAYTKIGNLIKLQCGVNVTVKGTGFVIGGIPFVGVSKTSYGKYINHAEPLETQQTYYARIDSVGGGRLGIFYSATSGAVATLTPSVGTFFIDIIYNID